MKEDEVLGILSGAAASNSSSKKETAGARK